VNLDSVPEPLGSTTPTFSTKKEARQTAARAGIDHFKALGIWPSSDSNGSIRKKKTSPPTPLPPKEPAASLTYAAQVTQLAVDLGLGTPEFRYEQDSHPAAPNFYKCSCWFKSGGKTDGPIGMTGHLLGKKNAREQCAKGALEWLLEEKERRAKVVGRVFGAEAVKEDESGDEEFVDAHED
jgi:hypothetical protein